MLYALSRKSPQCFRQLDFLNHCTGPPEITRHIFSFKLFVHEKRKNRSVYISVLCNVECYVWNMEYKRYVAVKTVHSLTYLVKSFVALHSTS